MSIEEFIRSDELNVQKILNNLLDAKKNLELKTEIDYPLELTKLHTYAKVLAQKYPKSSELLLGFIKSYLKYMVSYKRQSRKETIEAIKRMLEDEEHKPNHRDLK